MSSTQVYPIQCPQCGAEQQAELYDAINVSNAPALRDDLLANTLNRVECPHCGFGFRVDKQLLYHDAARGLMVYWMPGQEASYRENRAAFVATLDTLCAALPDDVEPPTVHVVFTRTELVERIFLLEAGLDERIIEYIKHMMYTRNLEKLDPRQKAILFNAEDSNERALCFVVQHLETLQLEGVLEFDRQAYEGLQEMFDRDEETVSLLELFPGPHISARTLLLEQAT